jgi:hypothetical protein
MDSRAVGTSRDRAPLYALYGANAVSMIGNQLSNLASVMS